MQLAQFAKSYKTMAINTAPPGQLVLMLFDGALRFMSAALGGFDEKAVTKRYETIHNNLIKTQSILRELQASLDPRAGREFSERMHALYDFMLMQIQQANFNKEPEPILVVERLLGGIRTAWAQMLECSASGNQAA